MNKFIIFVLNTFVKFRHWLTFFFLFSASTAYSQCFTYTVVACIDGRSLLHISGNQLWWQHLDFDPPGTHSNCPGPVTVNGTAWIPWNSIFTLPNSTTGCSLAANVLQCSYICNIIQAPSAANNWEAIYDFNDDAPGGPHMFTIQLQYFCPNVNAGADQSVCESTGANLNATGGVSYRWNPSADLSCTTCPNPTATPVSTTTYTVTATDVNGCSASDDVIVTILPSPVVNFTAQDVCLGNLENIINNSSGNITLWNWDFGNAQTFNQQAPAPVNYAASGVYNITLLATSDLGCSASIQQTISVFENPAGTINVLDAGCAAAVNGMADLIMSSGVAPFQFTWSNGESTEDLQNISQGNYSVIFTDANGCTGIASATVGLSPPLGTSLIVSDFSGFNISCNGGSNGSIDLTVANGVQPNTYSWSNGITTEDISGLIGGNYSVIVTDAAGCTIGDNVTLNEPPALSLLATGVPPICFSGSDGTADADAAGGVSPYVYSWSNSSTGSAITSLTDGIYMVSATDVNGCIAETTMTLQEPPQVVVSIQSVKDTIPFFGQSVQLNSSLQNATGTGTYSWHPFTSLSCSDCSDPVASPFTTTIYTLDFADDNGCTAFATVTVYVNSNKIFYVPNAFTPNGDGVNDIFRVYSMGVDQADILVFDRWGDKLFEWNSIDGGWDGTYKGSKASPGVYVYSAQLRWIDGQVKREKGSVTVLW